MPKESKKIIVDTNCYIRLYCSPLRPILGTVVSDYKLVTLTELKLETNLNSDVIARNPWMAHADIQAELAAACLKYREPKTSKIKSLLGPIRKMGDSILRQYCQAQKTEKIRTLSAADALALAAADIFDASLATDEWPMTLAAQTILSGVELFTSVGLLCLMEAAGSLTREQRIETVRIWCMTSEQLPRDWQIEYKKLFKEDPPNAQSVGQVP
ncbi:MAG: hypothetical protein Q8R67_08265 [Rhodoferax sp.]|nr:hypothetical protein [Rhodoferax sp.]